MSSGYGGAGAKQSQWGEISGATITVQTSDLNGNGFSLFELRISHMIQLKTTNLL